MQFGQKSPSVVGEGTGLVKACSRLSRRGGSSIAKDSFHVVGEYRRPFAKGCVQRVQHCCLIRSLQHTGGTAAVEVLAVGGGDVNECGDLLVRFGSLEECVNKRRLRRPLR